MRLSITGMCTALAITAVVWAGIAGWQFRQWIWQTTIPIRFTSDIERGFQWGRSGLSDGLDSSGHWHLWGLLNQYEKMQPEQSDWGNWLDYAPLRLAVMTAWAGYSQAHFPKITHWSDNQSYLLSRPVLGVNTVMELLAAAAAFGLVRSWTRRCDATGAALPWWRGSVVGLLAAAILWLNPAVVLDAYGWPTWDVWVVPMYLLAAWAATCDRWFWSGMAVGVGVMFKGQELAMTPVFLIWALASGKPAGAMRWAVGAAAAVAVVALPWLISYIPPAALATARAVQFNRLHHPWDVPLGVFDIGRVVDWPALCWVGGVASVTTIILYFRGTSILLMSCVRFVKIRNTSKMLMPRLGIEFSILIASIGCVFWPWMLEANRPKIWIGLAATAAVLIWSCLARRRALPIVAVVAVALLASPALFHGSYAWWDCGIGFGTRHWPRLTLGNTYNLPALLARHYSWNMDDVNAVAFTVAAHRLRSLPKTPIDVTIKQLLAGVCGMLILIAAIGLGRHARRRDRRLLVAVITPWLLLYLIPVQMQERYLLFAAAAACVCIGDGVGTALLGLLLSAATLLTTLQTMLDGSQGPGGATAFGRTLAKQFPAFFGADAAAKLSRLLSGLNPDAAWALLLCGAIFLYLSVAPSRASKDRR